MYLYMKDIEKCLVSLENLVSLYLQGLYNKESFMKQLFVSLKTFSIIK